jgi:hypothetical protein
MMLLILGATSSQFLTFSISSLRQNGTTGSLRLARMQELPVVDLSGLVHVT